ncbi:MAG: hypothetical protein WC781_02895 [Candidatus Pacearchaeota archaeon]|jgi:hypothetical protein
MIKNKKGAEMTIGTIVVIILAVLVLVFLVFGFSQGWGNLFDKIFNLGGGQVNVDTIKSACQVACSTGAKYDFCTTQRTIVFDSKTKVAGVTCIQLTKVIIAQPATCMKDGQIDNSVSELSTDAACKASGGTYTPAVEGSKWTSPVVETCPAITC